MIVVMSSPDPRRWYPGRRGMRSAVHIGQLTDVLWLQFAAVFVMQLARGGLVSSPALPDSSDTRWPSRPGQLAPALPGTAANVMGSGGASITAEVISIWRTTSVPYHELNMAPRRRGHAGHGFCADPRDHRSSRQDRDELTVLPIHREQAAVIAPYGRTRRPGAAVGIRFDETEPPVSTDRPRAWTSCRMARRSRWPDPGCQMSRRIRDGAALVRRYSGSGRSWNGHRFVADRLVVGCHDWLYQAACCRLCLVEERDTPAARGGVATCTVGRHVTAPETARRPVAAWGSGARRRLTDA